MAAETLDAAVSQNPQLNAEKPSQTDGLLLEGAHGWTPTMYIKLVQDLGVDTEVAEHLSETYGDRAFEVGRTRLAFLNVQAAEESLSRVLEIMTEELGWSEDRISAESLMAKDFFRVQMGKGANRGAKESTLVNLSVEEIKAYSKIFNALDYDGKGYVTINDIKKTLENQGKHVSGRQLREIITEIDTNQNGQVEIEEYLQMMSCLKHGVVAHSAFAEMAEENATSNGGKRGPIGGGI